MGTGGAARAQAQCGPCRAAAAAAARAAPQARDRQGREELETEEEAEAAAEAGRGCRGAWCVRRGGLPLSSFLASHLKVLTINLPFWIRHKTEYQL